MKDSKLSNNIFAALKAEKRIQILQCLMETSNPMQFSEISKKLSIIPSTLEYHLKQLEEQNLLTHIENFYAKNAYSKIVWNALLSLSKLSYLIPYLKTHAFPIDDTELLFKFIISDVEVVPDMISLLSLMKDKAVKNISSLKLAGTFNLELEERMMQLGNFEFNINEIEIISNYENFRDFLFYENFEYFLSFTDFKNIHLFLIDKCDFYLAIADDFGGLFLPDVENKMDFQQCLAFKNSTAVQWLNDVFERLKKKTKKIHLTKDFLKDKGLFDKYLRELDVSK